MRQLASNKFLDVPVPEIHRSCVLIKSQYVCMSKLSGQHSQSRKFTSFTKLLKKQQHVRKVLSYLVASGLSDTISKVRGRLMDVRIKQNVEHVSISGTIEAVGSDVDKFVPGDEVAAISLNGPIYSDFYAIPASLCRKLPEEVKSENGSGLFYAAIAGYIIKQLRKENILELAVISSDLVALILSQLPESFGVRVKTYSTVDDLDNKRGSEGGKAALIPCDENLNHACEYLKDCQLWVIVDRAGDLPDELVEASNIRAIRFPDPELNNLDPYSDIPLGLPEWLSQEALADGLSILASGDIELSELVDSQISVPTDNSSIINNMHSIQIVNSGESDRDYTIELGTSGKSRNSDDLGISFVGTGRFPREVHLPVISKQKKSHLRYIVDRHPFTARYVADHFHADYCSTDVEPVLRDEKTDLVFIATYHDSHAALSAEALKAGKAVFVEKPLALDFDQLKQVVDVYKKVGGFITVGYNRRYAPATRLALECLNEEEGPTTVLCSIRAYEIPPTNYYYWPKEGTRIAGNACHWIDLAYLLVGQVKPVSVSSMSSAEGRKDENYSITINFEDGSIAIIVFSTRGENLLGGYEWIDIKRGETSIFIDDFRRMKARRDGRTIKQWKGFRQKGHRQETIEVIDAVRNGKSLPIPFEDLVVGTALIFHARESLFSGRRISITDGSFPL